MRWVRSALNGPRLKPRRRGKSELLSGFGRKRGQFSSCAPLMSWQLCQLAALSQWVVVKSESWLDLEILFEKKGPNLTDSRRIWEGDSQGSQRKVRGTQPFWSQLFLHDAVLSQR